MLICQGIETKISQEHVKLIIYNLLCAMKCIKSLNIIHRDIKPANILINKDCEIKICDLGLSRTLPESCIGKGSGNTQRIRDSILKCNLAGTYASQKNFDIKESIGRKINTIQQNDSTRKKRSLSSHVSSRWYRAPEIALVEKQYDISADMWGIGCILFELLRATQIKATEYQPLFEGKSCYPLSPLNSIN